MTDPNAQEKPAPAQLKLTPDAAIIEIIERANDEAFVSGERILLGIAGGPGTGKSTLSADIVTALNKEHPGRAVLVPMDGFHMRQIKLKLLGFEAEKGAPHTFEAEAFADFLKLLKTAKRPISGPTYSRKIEDVVPNGFSVPAGARILVVEGNYLLLDKVHWRQVRDVLDISVFIEVPRDKVRARLLKRHAEHGLFTEERNIDHVENVDLANFDLVTPSKGRADVIIELLTET